jgi:hypothetical protein
MLIHVELSSSKRLALKFSEYVFPNFHPIALARWLFMKATRAIIQPIQRRYTVETARACLEESGLRVSRLISKETDPGAALPGPHVVLFVASKNLQASGDDLLSTSQTPATGGVSLRY